MLYELFNFLGDVPGARLMTYISFRAIVAGVMGLCISIWVGNWFIQLLRRKNISETQRDEKIDPFNVAKKGVPTMGGVVIIAAMLIPCLLMGNLSNVYMILMVDIIQKSQPYFILAFLIILLFILVKLEVKHNR